MSTHLIYTFYELLAVLVSCPGLTAGTFTWLYMDDVIWSDNGLPVSIQMFDRSLRLSGEEDFAIFIVCPAAEPRGRSGRSCCAVYFFDGTEKT